MEVRRRPKPGRGGGPETVENRTRLGRRAAEAVDRTVRIDRAIVEAIDVGGEGNGVRVYGRGLG